jgi:hypothetical protein
MSRQILAAYDSDGIYVYQAFKPEIVQAALAKGTFGAGFGLERMTWIKPSFGWMLHRSSYATKHRQEAILKIKLDHAGFATILAGSVETSHNPDLYPNTFAWKQALDASEVRHQWDPDRDLHGYKLERRAIQIGISGTILRRYVEEWIIGLEEVTALARAIQTAIDENQPLPDVPTETAYPFEGVL